MNPLKMSSCSRLPRLPAKHIAVMLYLFVFLLLIWFIKRIHNYVFTLALPPGNKNGHLWQSNFTTPDSKSSLLPLRVVSPGENIQVEDLQVHITTAVYYEDYPAASGFNLFLNGWARHNTSMGFKCCLLRSLPSGAIIDDTFTEVKSYIYHIYDQWIVDMQNTEFSCSISKKQIAGIEDAKFSYVAFAKESCLNVPSLAMKIIYPQPSLNSVGICLKITYGTLNPENMIEWFEYTRLMGVTKVFTYYFEVDVPTMNVLQYYQSIGFLEMQPIHPAVSKDGHKRGFVRPRFEQQAWVDEVMAANDCKHRMAKFDYVIILDMDEFILPKEGLRSYYDLLKAAEKQMSNVGAFSFDSYVVMKDWKPTRASPVHICQFTNRTVEPNYDGSDKNTRWAFRPAMTYWVQNNLAHCRKPYTVSSFPKELYILLHYRFCKHTWKGCSERAREKDISMLKYELSLVDRILRLPLTKILSNSENYMYAMIDWRKNYRRNTKVKQ